MSKIYICELCNKKFNQKIDYIRHTQKKTPCISIEKIKELNSNEINNNTKQNNLSTIFKYCLDVLRDNEHLTGDKALRTLAHLLVLRLIEPKLDNEINLNNYEYNLQYTNDEDLPRLLKSVRFSELSKLNEDNIPLLMKYVWNEILSEHPKTKNIFVKNRGFEIKHQSSYKKLITKLSEFNFEDFENDIIGDAYEEVISGIMTGKVLGEHFTPSNIKNMMVKLINPQLFDDGKIETIFDPSMGTGGFLITSIRHILKQSRTKQIPINWNFM